MVSQQQGSDPSLGLKGQRREHLLELRKGDLWRGLPTRGCGLQQRENPPTGHSREGAEGVNISPSPSDLLPAPSISRTHWKPAARRETSAIWKTDQLPGHRAGCPGGGTEDTWCH